MSILLDDKSFLQSYANLPGGRGSKRTMSKTSLGLNPESPRTQEACRELGILPQELSQKAPETFADGAPNQEIAQLRYNHYIVRYNQLLRDVTHRRRDLIKRKRHLQIQEQHQLQVQQQSSQQTNEPNTATLATNATHANQTNQIKSPRSITSLNNSGAHSYSNIRATTALNNTIPVSPGLLANYNKTVSYLRRSHDSPHIKKPKDLNIAIEEESKPFDTKLVQEIDKFNTTKRMKQKEAIRTYRDDLKRIKMIVDIEERTRRKEEIEKAITQQKLKQKKELKEKEQEKLEMLNEREQNFNKLITEGEQRINKKSAEKKKKVEEEREQKLRLIQEAEQRLQEKKRKADEVRERHNQEVEQHIEEMRQRLQDKMAESQEKVENTLNTKIQKIKEHIEELNEKVIVIKEDRVVKEKEFIHELVDRIKEKEFKNMAFEKQREQMYKEKVAKIKERNQQFAENALTVRMSEKEKVSNLVNKLSAAERRVAAQKLEVENEFKKRQEMRHLRMMDTLENFERKKRILEYEQEKVLEKERKTAEKWRYMQSQKEIIQNARLEAALQAKIERDRISEEVMNLRKLIRPRDLKERLAEEKEEKERENLLAQQQQQGQQQPGNPEQKKTPVSRTTKELKKIHEKGFKLLANFVEFDSKDLEKLNYLIETKTEAEEPALQNAGAPSNRLTKSSGRLTRR